MLSSDLYFGLYEALQRHQIEIPFPQRDLHLRSQLPPQLEAALTRLLSRDSTPGDRLNSGR